MQVVVPMVEVPEPRRTSRIQGRADLGAELEERARALITLAPLIGGEAGRALVDVAVEALPAMNRG